MNRLYSLFKMQLNMNFSISALKYRFTREKKKRWEPFVIAAAILFGGGPMYVYYILGMNGLFTIGFSLNHSEMVLTLAFIVTQVLILFFGLFYILGSFYFSHDLDTLVPLPLKPYEVLGSKFLVVMVNEYITAIPLLLPALIIFSIGTGQGIVFWFKGIFLLLTAPVIPLIIGALFVMLLMRVVNLRRNKDLLTIIGGFLGIIAIVGVNLVIQKMPKEGGQDFLKNLLASQTGLIEVIGRAFPPSIWATFGLSDNSLTGWGYFALFIGVSVALFFALLWLANLVFYKALIAGQEVSRKKRILTGIEIARQYNKVTSPVLAIFIREWKLLLRTPIYVINGLTGAIMGPLMILIMFFAKGTGPNVTQLINAIMNPEYSLYITLGGLGIMLFTAGMNIVASTSVSREGKNFWIAKMIPVSPQQQILAKFLQGYSISALGIVTTSIVLGIFIKFSFPRILVIVIIGLLTSVSMTALNLLLDVLHPKLSWNSEQEAMKQNMNGGLGMLVSIFIMAVLAACTVALILLQAPAWVIFVGLGIVSIILGIPSLLALFGVAEKKYKEMEV